MRALNSIFQQWGISASNERNTSGEPCTGAALDSSDIENPGIKCDCSYDSASTCHITQLYVHVLVLGLLSITLFDVYIYIVGPFPINAVPLLDIWFEWSLPK